MQISETVTRRVRRPNFLYIGVIAVLFLGLVGSVVFFSLELHSTKREVLTLRSELDAADERLQQSQQEAQAELDALRAEVDDRLLEISAKQEEIDRLQAEIEQLDKELIEARKNNPNQKIAYLTFDDGPSSQTLRILDVLREKDAVATFFVIKTDYPQYMKNIVEQGSVIGLHSYSHRYSEIYSSVDAYFADLERIQTLVVKQTGRPTDIMRFAGGSSNLVSRQYSRGIMSALTKEVANRGYQYFDWNCDSGDAAGNNVPAATLVENVKRGVGTKRQVCILMHDSENKRSTAEALPEIIDFLRNEGYIFATLDASTQAFHHRVQN